MLEKHARTYRVSRRAEIKLSKSDLQFSAHSVKLEYILVLVFALYSDYFIFFSSH